MQAPISANPAAPLKPVERKRDRALYQRPIESYHADRVGPFVDFDRLNYPTSPVWSPWENVASILILPSGAMVAGIFGYLLAIRPRIAQRVYCRTLDVATDNLRNLNIL